MNDIHKKSPQSQDREQYPLAWHLFFATSPELWIPGLVVIVSVSFFGVPDDLRLAVFAFAAVALLFAGSFVAVYLVRRSLNRRK